MKYFEIFKNLDSNQNLYSKIRPKSKFYEIFEKKIDFFRKFH